MKRIIYEINGSVEIMTPVINTMGEAEGFTEEDALQRAMKRIPKEALNVRIVGPDAIPRDRTFRDAWKMKEGRVEIHMPKARDILRDQLREKRQKKFEVLDVEYNKADEKGDTIRKAEIAAKRQALRDLPADPRIEQAQTPEELKGLLESLGE